MKFSILRRCNFLLLLFTLVVFQGNAQNSTNECASSLKNATKEYEAGHFSECIQILTPCLPTLKTQRAFQAYRLLSLCYLNLNDDAKARECAIKLLQLKPDYRVFPFFDPVEFTNLLSQYEVWSRLQVGMKFGFNINSIRPINNYSLTSSAATFKPQAGYQITLLGEYNFTKKTSLSAEFQIETLNYARTSDNVSGWHQEFKEKMRYFKIPIMVKYNLLQINTFRMKAELAFGSGFLNMTNTNVLLHNPITGDNIQNSANQKSQRNKVLLSILPGISIDYITNQGILNAGIRYGIGLNNIVNPEKRYENFSFIMANQYIDSDISFNTFYFSVGYIIPLPKFYAVKLKK